MRVALLTTDTPHHRYFAATLATKWPLAGILVETEGLKAPFETAHPFEKERDAYERSALLGGRSTEFETVAPTKSFARINDAAAVAELQALKLDLTIIFGTRRCADGGWADELSQSLGQYGDITAGRCQQWRGYDGHRHRAD